MSIVGIYILSLVSSYVRYLPLFIIASYYVVTSMSKDNVDYAGGDLQHFYTKKFECDYSRSLDKGYDLLVGFINSLTNCNSSLAFFLESLLSYLLYDLSVSGKRYDQLCPAFFSATIFGVNFKISSGSRQHIAELLMVLSYIYINKNLIRYLFFGLIGCPFHSSAIIFFFPNLNLMTTFKTKEILKIIMMLFLHNASDFIY